jgi:prepilin-type N-terminal cleavage/methylation domain-containing protein
MNSVDLGNKRRGMTLVEMVVVIAITTVLMLIITNTVLMLYESNAHLIAQANEVDAARRALTTWTQDARQMLFSDNGAWPIAIMEPHRMGFYSNVDGDAAVEYVIYQVSSSTLRKFVYKPTGNPPVYSTSTPNAVFIFSEHVHNISQGTTTFRYFDTNGNELATGGLLSAVRFVQIQLIVNVDPARAPGEFLLRASVAPRNIKDNL